MPLHSKEKELLDFAGTNFFILEGDEIIKCSLGKWLEWSVKSDWIIDVIEKDGIKISTVFIGVAAPEGIEQIFETAVFGGDNDGALHRYSTLAEAKSGHAKVVDTLFG